MKQYIDKAVIKSELERIEYETNYEPFTDNVLGKRFVCRSLLSFIDTIESKEVDFEEEFNNYAKDILACDVQFKPFTHLYKCAQYFYELGLKA